MITNLIFFSYKEWAEGEGEGGEREREGERSYFFQQS